MKNKEQILRLAPEGCLYKKPIIGRVLSATLGPEVIIYKTTEGDFVGHATCDIPTLVCPHDGLCPLSYRGSGFGFNNPSK